MNMGSSDRQFIIASSTARMRMLSKNHSQTLKELLQKPPLQNVNTKTDCLSPNGRFKYMKRQTTKNCYQGVIPKTRLVSSSSQDRIRRPLNCFMVFSHLERKRVAEEHPELHNADLSKILGKRWKTLSALEKQPYIEEAERIRQLHTEIYPDYKYQPRRKQSNKKVNKPESILDEKSATPEDDLVQQKTDLSVEQQEESTQSLASEKTASTNNSAPLFQMQNYLNHTPHASPSNENNNNMHSFPPTPDISPTLLEHHQQPVFVFDNFPQFNNHLQQQQQQQQNMESMQNMEPVQNQFDLPAMDWLMQQNQSFQTSFYENFSCPPDAYYNNNNNNNSNNVYQQFQSNINRPSDLFYENPQNGYI